MPFETILPLAGSWLWSNYGKSVASKIFNRGREKWDESKWDTAARAYRAKIIKQYNSMQIMGMAEPVPLTDIFTDVYMLDKPTAFGRFDIERLKQMSADPDAPPSSERVNGLRLVMEDDDLFILGKPGAGKTTFLKYIALQAAEQNIDKIPIFITLKHWADSRLNLMPFIAERFDICDFPAAQPFVEELLKSGNAIVLFDGLDEVNQESGQRDKQTREMNNFIEKYDQTQCLITCRIAANDYSFEPFTYIEIADFTKAQIQTFARNWFRKNGERDEASCAKFLAEFAKEENRGVRDLARTPLLLTLLCLAFDETLTIPPRRVEIYEEALDALLKKWDSSRSIKRAEVYRKLSLGHKENMLARIAAETFERNEYFISQSELERHITDFVRNVPPHDTSETADGEAILKAIEAQHGIFVERSHRLYSFSHLTFQEYFTAKYIVANASKGTLTHLVNAHCADTRWREVFLLTTSLLPDACQFMKTFRHRVDELLGWNENLQAVLLWADKKSTSIQANPWLMRQFYLLIDLYYPSLDRARDRARARERALSRARVLALAFIPYFDPVSNLDRERDRALARDHNHDNALARDRDHALALASDLGLSEFANELATLSLPNQEASAAEWEVFADKLRALMREHGDIGHDWNLTDTQAERLSDYLNATRLLQDCLELATMPPDEKKAILNSLYLPLERVEEGQSV